MSSINDFSFAQRAINQLNNVGSSNTKSSINDFTFAQNAIDKLNKMGSSFDGDFSFVDKAIDQAGFYAKVGPFDKGGLLEHGIDGLFNAYDRMDNIQNSGSLFNQTNGNNQAGGNYAMNQKGLNGNPAVANSSFPKFQQQQQQQNPMMQMMMQFMMGMMQMMTQMMGMGQQNQQQIDQNNVMPQKLALIA